MSQPEASTPVPNACRQPQNRSAERSQQGSSPQEHDPAQPHASLYDADEAVRLRRLQHMMHAVTQLLERDRTLSVERASQLVADSRRAALAMFPDKAAAFDMLYWPQLQRLMRQRYRMQ